MEPAAARAPPARELAAAAGRRVVAVIAASPRVCLPSNTPVADTESLPAPCCTIRAEASAGGAKPLVRGRRGRWPSHRPLPRTGHDRRGHVQSSQLPLRASRMCPICISSITSGLAARPEVATAHSARRMEAESPGRPRSNGPSWRTRRREAQRRSPPPSSMKWGKPASTRSRPMRSSASPLPKAPKSRRIPSRVALASGPGRCPSRCQPTASRAVSRRSRGGKTPCRAARRQSRQRPPSRIDDPARGFVQVLPTAGPRRGPHRPGSRSASPRASPRSWTGNRWGLSHRWSSSERADGCHLLLVLSAARTSNVVPMATWDSTGIAGIARRGVCGALRAVVGRPDVGSFGARKPVLDSGDPTQAPTSQAARAAVERRSHARARSIVPTRVPWERWIPARTTPCWSA